MPSALRPLSSLELERFREVGLSGALEGALLCGNVSGGAGYRDYGHAISDTAPVKSTDRTLTAS